MDEIKDEDYVDTYCAFYISDILIVKRRLMKLAILCTMVKRFGRKGFYNSQEIGLGRALAAMGHTVIIYKGTNDKSQAEDVNLENKLTIHYMFMPYFGAHGFIRSSRMDSDFDGMLCFSDQQIFLRHVYRFCVKNRIVFVPYVGTTYSLYGDSIHGRVMNFAFSVTTLPVYKRIPVLAKTEAVKTELINLGVPSDQVIVSPVGLDSSVLKKDFKKYDRDLIRKEYGYKPEDVILLNIARLDPDKRTLSLLDLLYKVRDKKRFRLLIIGEGVMRRAVDQRIDEYGISDIVTIIDRVPYEDMWKIYLIADYYLNLSKTEIFGMAIMEAVYYHTSVAAIDAIGPSLTLKGMKGHVLCRNDEEIIRWILKKYPSEEDLAYSARKMIRDFSWNRTAEAFLQLIEKTKSRGGKV